MRRRVLVFAMCSVLVGFLPGLAAQPKREWQAGVWRDTARTSETVGGVTSGTVTGGSLNATTTTVRRVHQLYLIEADEYLYHAEQRLRWRWSKPVPLTVNERVKFAVQKDKVFVIGEDGKEYELSLTKRVKKV